MIHDSHAQLVIKRPKKKKRNQKNGKDLASFLETINYARVPYDRSKSQQVNIEQVVKL